MLKITQLAVVLVLIGVAPQAMGQAPVLLSDATRDVWYHPKSGLALLDDRAIFSLQDFGGGYHLWFGRLNGPAPQKIAELEHPAGPITRVGDRVLFAHGPDEELPIWVSDGTRPGTLKVGDVTGSGPHNAAALGQYIMFWTSEGDRQELWSTDGTPDSVELLITVDLDESPGLVPFEGELVFASKGCRLWTTDGTLVGTTALLEVESELVGSETDCVVARGPSGALILTTVNVPGVAWLVDRNGAVPANHLTGKDHAPTENGVFFHRDLRLWFSDGTEAGTTSLMTLMDARPRLFHVLGSSLVFSANSHDVWRSDGTPAGTELVAQRDKVVLSATRVGDRVYLLSDGEIWETDGTASGTKRLASPRAGSVSDQSFAATDDGFAFWTNQALTFTQKGQSERTRVWPAHVSAFTDSSSLGSFQEIAGKVHFEVHPSQRWKTDGGPAGTERTSALPENSEFLGKLGEEYLYRVEDEYFVSESDFSQARLIPNERRRDEVDTVAKLGSRVILDDRQSFLVEVFAPIYTEAGTSFRISAIDSDGIYKLAVPSIFKHVASVSNLAVFVNEEEKLEIAAGKGTCERLVVAVDGSFDGRREQTCRSAPPVTINGVEIELGKSTLWGVDADGRTPIHPPLDSESTYGNIVPEVLIVHDERAYFLMDGPSGTELWSTDGTSQGTELVHRRIVRGRAIRQGTWIPGPAVRLKGDSLVFIAAYDETDARAIFEYRQSEGVRRVTPLEGEPGAYALGRAPLFAFVNEKIVYSGRHPRFGVEPYALDFGSNLGGPAASDGVQEAADDGCGCSNTKAPSGAAWLFVLVIFLARRSTSCSRGKP